MLAEFNIHDYQAALDDINKAISMNYKTPESYFWRGSALLNLSKNEEAILDYDQAIKLKPKYDEAFKERGNAYYNLKDYQKERLSCFSCDKPYLSFTKVKPGKAFNDSLV